MTWESIITFVALVWLTASLVVLAGWGLYVFGRYAAGELRYESAVRRGRKEDRERESVWTDPLVPWIAEPKDKP